MGDQTLTDKTSRPSGRAAAVRVRAGNRTASSKRWLERQLNDPYVAEAARRGYRSRAAFKLLQIDEKYRLLRPGLRVVDLGAAPGGWTQVVVERVRPTAAGATGRVVGLDILPIDSIPGAELLQADFLANDALPRLHASLGGPVDLVLSDMAAPTTGHGATDHLRVVALAEAAFSFALEVLAEHGSFVCKVFQGGAEQALLTVLKRSFAQVRHFKPAASRQESRETYLVATGFRGVPATTSDDVDPP